MKKILITGYSGMVGYSVGIEAVRQNYEVVGLGRENRHKISGISFETGDLLDPAFVSAVMMKHRPELVIHLAANTNHGDCERHPELTRRLHVDASAHLAKLARELDARFVHASTEAVYGNHGPGPKMENYACQPVGVYAVTKKEAEERIISVNADALILRITPVGFLPNGTKRTLAEWLVSQFERQAEITGYENVTFTPIASSSLARIILAPELTKARGIYNCGIAEVMSKYEFAGELATSLGFDLAKIRCGRRPPVDATFHGEMDSTSLFKLLNSPVPSASEMFADLARDFNRITKHQSKTT